MNTHEFWMQYALRQARLAQKQQEVPVGAVLVVAGQLVAASYNHPIGSCDPSAHADACEESRRRIEALGFRQDERATEAIRQASEISWIRESVAVYRRL